MLKLVIILKLISITTIYQLFFITLVNQLTLKIPKMIQIPSGYNTGSPIPQFVLDTWLGTVKAANETAYLPNGTYCFPPDYHFDFGETDFILIGEDKEKTIITTYDGTAATNFAIPEKIDITKENPKKPGVYQIDVTGPTSKINSAFSGVTPTLDNYIEIGPAPTYTAIDIAFSVVKSRGYVTELDTSDPTLPATNRNNQSPTETASIDGLYVVAKTEDWRPYSGGGFTHFTLNWPGAATDPDNRFLQGTVLERKTTGGVTTWKRFINSTTPTGKYGGFFSTGNYKVTNITFNNVRFYLFSPFSITSNVTVTDIYHTEANVFQLKNCVFKQCQRVLSSTSGSQSHTAAYDNWYLYNWYYPLNRFTHVDFDISDCEFSYIHESILWAPPPAKNYTVCNNYIHDCYTLITAFYLQANLGNATLSDVDGLYNTIITNNTFLRIRPLNAGMYGYLTLVRTFGTALISNNVFDDIATLRPLYVCGSNTIIDSNYINCYTFDFGAIKSISMQPLIISKFISDNGSITDTTGGNNGGEIKITNNMVISSTMGLFACEESPSANISNNTIYLYATNRYITRISTLLDTKKVYQVIHLGTFQAIASMYGYDTSIVANDYVYYNNRTSQWTKLSGNINISYVFSRGDGNPSYSVYIKISNNLIEAGSLTYYGSTYSTPSPKTPGNVLATIAVDNNEIYYSRFLHIGITSVIDNYIITSNTFKYSGIQPIASNLIRNLIVKNNIFLKGFDQGFCFYASKLVLIQSNLFTQNEEYNTSVIYEDFGYTYAHVNSLVDVKDGEEVVIKDNNIYSGQTGGYPIEIHDRQKISVENNHIDLNIPSWQIVSQYRAAIDIYAPNVAPYMEVIGNVITPQTTTIRNRIINFESPSTAITMLTVDNNRATNPAFAFEYTIYAPSTTIATYYRGFNLYKDADSFGAVTNYLQKGNIVLNYSPLLLKEVSVTKLIGNNTAPTIAVGPGAGTGASAYLEPNAHDIAGTIILTTGTSLPGSAVLATITFGTPFTTPPHVILTPVNLDALNFDPGSGTFPQIVPVSGQPDGVTTTSFNIVDAMPGYGVIPSRFYFWNYQVIQ